MSDINPILFHVDPDKLSEVRGMMVACGLESVGDFMNNAVTCFMWAINQARDGADIAAANGQKGTYKTLEMDCLNTARRGSGGLSSN